MIVIPALKTVGETLMVGTSVKTSALWTQFLFTTSMFFETSGMNCSSNQSSLIIRLASPHLETSGMNCSSNQSSLIIRLASPYLETSGVCELDSLPVKGSLW
jgi:hypothetical protein